MDRVRLRWRRQPSGEAARDGVDRPRGGSVGPAAWRGSGRAARVDRGRRSGCRRGGNPVAIGLALDGVLDSAGGDLRQVLSELDRLQIDEFEFALESIDPEFYDVFLEVGLMSYRSIAEAVEGHFAEIDGARGVDLAGNLHHDWRDLLADGGGHEEGRQSESHRASGFSVWAGAYGTFAANDEETDVTEFSLID